MPRALPTHAEMAEQILKARADQVRYEDALPPDQHEDDVDLALLRERVDQLVADLLQMGRP